MSIRNPIIIPKTPALGNLIRPIAVSEENIDVEVGKSLLGNPVYSNLIFAADPDTVENQDLVINDVLLEVYQPKNIVVTQVAGRPGTIKEYISDGDFEINVRGRIVSNQPNVYPIEDVTALKNLLNLNKTITISSNFLNVFEISTVVVTEYSFGEIEGVRNIQPFFIRLISDTPIEIAVNA